MAAAPLLRLAAAAVLLLAGPVAAAEGGGSGVTEPSFLDTPTYTLALVLTCFLVVSLAFEQATHWLIRFLRRRKREGLATAITNLVTELTLVGFIALLLTVLQGPISKICVPYNSGSYDLWSLISNVQGCDCCLSSTGGVSTCFQVDRACGYAYCNCAGQDPACVYPTSDLELLLNDTACGAASACGVQYAAVVKASPVADTSLAMLECDGMLQRNKKTCGEGEAPLISVTAQHQIHLFIFSVAMAHVLMGVGMVLLASWRIHMWRRACADENDEHAQSVRAILLKQSSAHTQQQQQPARWRNVMRLGSRVRRTLIGQSGQVGSPRGGAAVAPEADAEGGGQPQAPQKAGSMRFVDLVRAAAAKEAAQAAAQDAPDGSEGSGPLKGSSGSGLDAATGSSEAEAAVLAAAAAAAAADAAATAVEEGQAGSAAATAAAAAAKDAAADAAAGGGNEQGPPQAPEATGAAPAPARTPSVLSCVLNRRATIRADDHVGWLKEHLICLAMQLNLRPVAASDIRLLRASFMLTHRVPQGFDFWQYITESMEDDFAQIVGVNLEMWITLVVFLLISGPLGWSALLFLCLAAALLLLVNMKLVAIIRHVCRGCRVNQLDDASIFWFRRPSLMLHPIKFLLFLCSFLFGTSIFFVWSFGAGSCPFTSRGNAFWFAWSAAPWYVCLIVSGVIYLDASMRTLPVYSLAVQLGSDFKHHMLPKGVREKLLRIAQHIREKHQAQAAAAAAAATADGSRRARLGAATVGASEWVKKMAGGAQ